MSITSCSFYAHGAFERRINGQTSSQRPFQKPLFLFFLCLLNYFTVLTSTLTLSFRFRCLSLSVFSSSSKSLALSRKRRCVYILAQHPKLYNESCRYALICAVVFCIAWKRLATARNPKHLYVPVSL